MKKFIINTTVLLLTLFTSCKKQPANYVSPQTVIDNTTSINHNDVIGGPAVNVTSLIGSKWIVTKYIQNLTSIYPNDTLDFINSTQYTINNSTPHNYSMNIVYVPNQIDLGNYISLHSFTTVGGDWSGEVQGTYINNWTINNTLFSDMLNSSTPSIRLWMVRIY